MKKKFRGLWAVLAVCVCTLVTGDSEHFVKKEKKPIPSALDVLESCRPKFVHNIGQINISVADVWILTHSKHCLGYDNVVSAISIGGDDRVDKDLSIAVVKGYIRSLYENKISLCTYDVITIPSLNQESNGVISYMYPFVLSCNDFE